MGASELKRPQKSLPLEEMYRWTEVQEFIEKKYGHRLYDFRGGTKGAPYENFWHWLDYQGGNPGTITLPQPWEVVDEPEFVRIIVGWLYDEGFAGEEMWVSW